MKELDEELEECGLEELYGPEVQPATTKPGITYEVIPGPPGAVYAHAEGKMVGSLLFGIDGTNATVWRINVIDTHHRLGVGTGLYQKFEEEMRTRGVDKVAAALVETPEAVSFWKSLGFERDSVYGKDFVKRLRSQDILPATEEIIYEAELKMPGYPTQYHRITKGQEPGRMIYYKWMIKSENGIWTSVKRFTLKEIMAFIPTQNKRLKVTLPLKGG